MLDKRFTFSVSARTLLLLGASVMIAAAAGGMMKVSHDQKLREQKAEFKRRLYFLDRGNKTLAAAGKMLEAYGAGDAAFGLARQKAVDAGDSFAKLARSRTESDLALAAKFVIDDYTNCRGRIVECDGLFQSAELRYTKTYDELDKELKTYDWRSPEDQADDDPLEGYSPPN